MFFGWWNLVRLHIIIRVILGLYWDTGKENGNYYNGLLGFRLILRLYPYIKILYPKGGYNLSLYWVP